MTVRKNLIRNFALLILSLFLFTGIACAEGEDLTPAKKGNENLVPVRKESEDLTPVKKIPTSELSLQQLAPEQIKQFVTALALIKQYYIKPVQDKALFNYAVEGMVSNLDPHSSFLDEEDLKELKTTVSGEFVGIGVELTSQESALKVISPLEGTPADKAGIKPGDLIIKIDDQLVQNLSLRDAVNRIKGRRGTQVTLTIIRKGTDQPLVITVPRDVVKIQTVKSKILQKGFGYIRLTFFQGPVDELLVNAIENLKKEGPLKGIILDLRNNPGGLLDESGKVAELFLDPNKTKRYNDLIVYTKGRLPGSDIQLKAHGQDLLEGIPMVTLINGGTASASEIVAGALQDYGRSLIIGTRSFGKGSVQTVFPIDSTSAIKLTTALYYTPAGRAIQAKGIQPDVVVPNLTIADKKTEDGIDINEANFQNHLLNGDSKDFLRLQEVLKQQREMEIKLAKTDYQLYEALLILKSKAASRKDNDNAPLTTPPN